MRQDELLELLKQDAENLILHDAPSDVHELAEVLTEHAPELSRREAMRVLDHMVEVNPDEGAPHEWHPIERRVYGAYWDAANDFTQDDS